MMQVTSLGFKKPEDLDMADLKIFIGDNMDLIESLITEIKNDMKIYYEKPLSPKDGDIWIDRNIENGGL